MIRTGVFAKKEDVEKLKLIAQRGWMPGEVMITFSVGEGIRKDQAAMDARKVCHQVAIAYGLPEITGYYGILASGEFVQSN